MIAINILMLLLLISFSLRILLLEKQESSVCAFSAAPASGPARGAVSPTRVSQTSGLPEPKPSARALLHVWHRHAPASLSISSKPGPPSQSQLAKLGGV